MSEEVSALAESIAALALHQGRQVAVAESLTSGKLAAALGAASRASEWFRGGIVAYQHEVKYRLLGVDEGAVVTARCAEQLVRGALDAMAGDAALAVTGVGGPGPEEGKPAGTVFIAVGSRESVSVFEHRFAGEPSSILEQVTLQALEHLGEFLDQREV